MRSPKSTVPGRVQYWPREPGGKFTPPTNSSAIPNRKPGIPVTTALLVLLLEVWYDGLMATAARVSQPSEIAPLREEYREEMNCQIVHDSIHRRPGWTQEYALELDGAIVGYGSVAVGGPWRDAPALYEFYVQREQRMRTFDLFASLLTTSGARIIETQSNAPMLAVMVHTFARNIRAESILFRDTFQTSLAPPGANFRAAAPEDTDAMKRRGLDEGANWVVTWNGEIAGAGDVLYHYNPPYGDIYMAVAEPFRRRGLGAFLVQELKAVCRAGTKVPGARCSVGNVASRRTLQRSGFVPCGNIVSGDLA
jgi:GNAT superfamily N-acetyltransferase